MSGPCGAWPHHRVRKQAANRHRGHDSDGSAHMRGQRGRGHTGHAEGEPAPKTHEHPTSSLGEPNHSQPGSKAGQEVTDASNVSRDTSAMPPLSGLGNLT
jgi:hypothetical protein